MGIPITPDDPTDGGTPTCIDFMPAQVWVRYRILTESWEGFIPTFASPPGVVYLGNVFGDFGSLPAFLFFNSDGDGTLEWTGATGVSEFTPDVQCNLPFFGTDQVGDTIEVQLEAQ